MWVVRRVILWMSVGHPATTGAKRSVLRIVRVDNLVFFPDIMVALEQTQPRIWLAVQQPLDVLLVVELYEQI